MTVLFADLVGFTSRAEQLDPEDVAASRAVLRPSHGARALRRHRREVHRRRGDGAVRRSGRARGRSRAGGAGGARDPRLGARAGATSSCGSRSPPARRSSRSTRGRSGRGDGRRRRRQHGGPAAGRGARERRPRRRGDLPRDGRHDRVPRARAGRGQGQGRAGRRSGRRCDRAPPGSTARRAPPRAARRPRSASSTLLSDALARARRSARPARHARRRAGDRQEPARATSCCGRSSATGAISWRQGRSLPYGDGVTFWALGEMVKAQAGILETDDDEGRGQARRAVAELVDDPRARAGSSAPPAARRPRREDGRRGRRGEAFAAWRRFFEALAERRPLVLVFEDLHWADDGLLDFVDHLVDWATACRCSSSARRGRSCSSAGRVGRRQARTRARSRSRRSPTRRRPRLSTHLLERALLPAETQPRCSSVPAATRSTPSSTRGCSSERLATTLPLPETVQGIIAARLDALSPTRRSCYRTRP